MKTKSIHSQVWLALFLLSLCLTGRSQSSNSVIVGKEDTLYSHILHEKRSFFISLPASYENDNFYAQKHYPVLILLDADTHFSYTASMIQYLSAGETEQIPELIVIGVRNTDRTRDMTSNLIDKPNRFLSFLETELLPRIDQRYRTAPYRILVGHSLAGLFTLDCLLNQSRFKAYIAIDPTLTWHNDYLPQTVDSLLKVKTFTTTKLYFSQANNPFESGQHTGTRGKAFDTFRSSLASNRSGGLSERYAYYDQETHFSIPFRSIYDGLQFIFEGYSFPFQTFLTQGSEGIEYHYQQLFTQLGVNLSPPGKVLNQVGLFLVQNQNQIDKGLELLRLNECYYPNSLVVHRSLGLAYQTKGEKSKALQQYKKVLSFDRSDEQASKAINVLTHQ